MSPTQRVVVVGAGHAAAQLCTSLRQNNWHGEILMVGEEPDLPYQRPPLSKTYLAGATSLDDIHIRPPEYYKREQVAFRHARVTKITRDAATVQLSDGDTLHYDHLVLCTGARPRMLDVPGAELAGVHSLRNAADAEAIRRDLASTTHATIIGAGYIGLETAASLRKRGIAVTVLEVAERVMQRVTAPEVSAFYDRVHRENGVDLRLGVRIAGFEGNRGRAHGVRLVDGDVIPTDLIVVGIGVLPNVELAQEAGLTIDDGIVIDAYGRTDDDKILAAGDCASHLDARYQRRVRLECVANAVEHAKSVAATISLQKRTISALPWFWSDQYDLKLQIAGINAGYDSTVMRGNPANSRSFACFYYAGSTLLAADCVNSPKEFTFTKRSIAEGLNPDPAALADPKTPLAALL